MTNEIDFRRICLRAEALNYAEASKGHENEEITDDELEKRADLLYRTARAFAIVEYERAGARERVRLEGFARTILGKPPKKRRAKKGGRP